MRGYPTLWVLLVLSIWEAPSSTTVNAFVGVTTRTAPRVGGRCADAVAKHGLASRSRCPLHARRRPTAAAAASSTEVADTPVEERDNPAAAEAEASVGGADTRKRKKKKKKKEERIRVTTAAEMRKLLSEEGGKTLFELDARGDSQAMLEARDDDHPVLEALRERLKAGTKPGSHEDGLKVTLPSPPGWNCMYHATRGENFPRISPAEYCIHHIFE